MTMTTETIKRIENFTKALEHKLAIMAKWSETSDEFYWQAKTAIEIAQTAIIYLEPLPDKEYYAIIQRIYDMERDLSEWRYNK